MIYTKLDHDIFLRACAHPKITPDEREFLAAQASLSAACESVPRSDYLHAQALVGGALSTTTPIFDR